MPTPYDYTVAQPNVGAYFEAMRQGRADRLAVEQEQRNNALAKYLPGALRGEKDQRDLAMQSASPDQQINLQQIFQGYDTQRLQQYTQEAGALAQASDTPEKWAQALPILAQKYPDLHKDAPFEARDQVIAQALGIKDLLTKLHNDRSYDLQRGQLAESSRHNRAMEGAAAARGVGAGPLTATDKNAILEADQAVIGNKSAVSLLQRAKGLSSRAYSGPGANTRGEITALFGASGGEATLEFDNLLQQQVLPQLKAIFGGQPTEGERKILLDLQGSSRLPHNVRTGIIDTAIELASARLKFNEDKARDLRGGDYYRKTPDYPDYTRPSPTQGGTPIVRSQAEFDALPSGAVYVEPDGKKYRKP